MREEEKKRREEEEFGEKVSVSSALFPLSFPKGADGSRWYTVLTMVGRERAERGRRGGGRAKERGEGLT